MPLQSVQLRTALVRDASTGNWLRFQAPRRLLVAETALEVANLLEEVQAESDAGRWVVGYVGYEAGAAFDPAFPEQPVLNAPLAVFGVFDRVESADEPRPFWERSDAEGARSDIDQKQHAVAVGSIRDAIREGDTYQVNLTYRLKQTVRPAPFDVFRKLLHAQAATYAAYLDCGPFVLASASPELFFRKEGDRLTSRPMKGTLGKDAGQKASALDLAASQKDRAENLMIVDMVRNDLSRICEPGSVTVPDLWTLESYPTVWQMTSTVEGRSSAPVPAIFRALFPPASITGAPKAAAMGIIHELEASQRGCYTGAIGFVKPGGDAQFNVAIRTALIHPDENELTYGVGGGIVWDSTADSEWAETLSKAAILRRRTPEFSLLETLRWTVERGYLLRDRHLDRMAKTAAFFAFPFDRSHIEETLSAAAAGWSGPDRRVRLTLAKDGSPTVGATVLPPMEQPFLPRLALAPACVPSADAFLRHKTTNRAVYEDLQQACPGFDDVLLWNERGEVTESCIANVFFHRDGKWFTPPVTAGLLPGTLRAELLQNGQALEAALTVAQVLAGVPLLLGNSVRGLYRPAALYKDGERVNSRPQPSHGPPSLSWPPTPSPGTESHL